jgi:hypothetical protein
MSTVVHHLADLGSAADEARRVLRHGAPLLLRQVFAGRHDGIPWAKLFPSALPIAEQRHPRLESVIAIFERSGFRHRETRRVSEVAARDLHEYALKVETRADSTLALIDDADFERGLAALRRMAVELPREPVTAILDLIVLT